MGGSHASCHIYHQPGTRVVISTMNRGGGVATYHEIGQDPAPASREEIPALPTRWPSLALRASLSHRDAGLDNARSTEPRRLLVAWVAARFGGSRALPPGFAAPAVISADSRCHIDYTP